MEAFLHDLRFGIRMLLKRPGFTLVAVVALALGVGANTAIFSVVNAVLLRPLPYEEPDRLMMVWEDATAYGFPRNTPAPANYVDWRDQNHVFESMAAIEDLSVNLTGAGEPERIEGVKVSSSLFPMLGVQPAAGRWFTGDEDRPGNEKVVILSHGLWQRRFGADREIIGQTVTLNNTPYTVVGVMPQSFQFPDREAGIWTPIAFTKEDASGRGGHYLRVVARLKAGVTFEQARADMETIARRLEQDYPKTNTNVGVTLVPLHEEFVGDIRPALIVLLGAVGFVLLIACANVANLLLARAAARQKEVALRSALGASRSRIIRQLLTESLLLATAGGAVGLLLAFWGVSFLVSLIPDSLSQARGASVDASVLGFTFLISVATGIIFGLAPALQLSRPDLNETLKEGGRSGSAGGRNPVRSLLVVSEVALALVLLIGAGLMIKSFARLRSVDPGFRPDKLLTMTAILPTTRYPTPEKRRAFYTQVLERVESLPGVQSAGVISHLPLTFKGNHFIFSIEGRPAPPPGQELIAVYRVVTTDYFRTMSIPVLKGREFSKSDTDKTPRVFIINQAMAERFWPGEDVVGKRIKIGTLESPESWATIIGVSGDVRQFELENQSKPEIYSTYLQDPRAFTPPRDFVIRTAGDPLSLAAAVRDEIWAVDKDQPVSNIDTMETVVSRSVARSRFNMLLLAIFAAIALVLAGVGIYGVMSYSVVQRTHEIGIRVALGAQAADILKAVIGQALKLTVAGVAIGLAGAFALTRVLESLLYGVSATDLTTFVAIPLLLSSVALAASYIPARKAMKVDPMIALRYE